ncbi:rab-GTPase-TBC domain-containing protein [Lyophyllum atratum]|nr:rab-GTPase-TBC domain-containing protein [Lyophyllum atratum]
MVEIKRTHIPSSPSTSRNRDDDRYRLVYSKSKVYVNPTAYARDNIPGFVALVKREALNPIYLLAWIPETLLNEKGSSEWDKFVKIEEKVVWDEDDDDIVLIDLPTQRPESYAFSVPLTSIYSLLVHPPTLSSWYGSIGINLINGDTLPTLHFHDDESRSFTLPTPPQPLVNNNSSSYPPAPTHIPKSGNSWGGEDLLSRLRSYAHILRSTLQPTLFLIDPSRADIEAHSTQIFADDAVDDILAQSSYANSHSPVPAHRRPRPISTSPPVTPNPYSHRSSVLHRSLGSPTSNAQSSSQARMALLQSFSNITRATRHAAQNILSHPLAKPIVPHLPDPVRSLVNANGEWEWGSWVEKGGVGEFESARVYLARWARIVAEEGERARRREAHALPSASTSSLGEETSSLGIFELLHSTSNLPTPKSSRDPTHPVDEKFWAKWFTEDGRPKIRMEEMKREVFRRGVSAEGKFRQTVWPFILGVYEWDVTRVERERKWEEKRKLYHELKDQWCGVPEVFDRPDVVEERHRIDVDCRRTDRTQPLFTTPVPTASTSKSKGHNDEKSSYQRYSTIAPNMSDIGAQSPTNEHIDRHAGILLTYNFFEKDLGYVQGMSDLCAPIYVVMDANEEMTFWCFVEVMHRMKQNFLRDQSGMKKQLLTLQQLIGVMDPELYKHLEKTDGLNLFFCFRWVLIAFKREFPFNDVLRLWEVLWTDYYSNEFVLFVALAVLESHRDMILRYLVEFDEILKYCNELSMTIELDTTLAQAEVLFLSFAQLVADIDRRKAEELPTPSSGGIRHRGNASAGDAPGTTISMPTLSENLRELLDTGRP